MVGARGPSEADDLTEEVHLCDVLATDFVDRYVDPDAFAEDVALAVTRL